jgi:hypothetical protein
MVSSWRKVQSNVSFRGSPGSGWIRSGFWFKTARSSCQNCNSIPERIWCALEDCIVELEIVFDLRKILPEIAPERTHETLDVFRERGAIRVPGKQPFRPGDQGRIVAVLAC